MGRSNLPPLLLALLFLAGCGAQKTLLGTQGSYIFVGSDCLANPGQQVDLRAQFRQGDFLAAPGYAVRFYRDGRLYKVVETDEGGMGAASFTPAEPGDYLFTAELAPIGLAEPPPPVELVVASRTPETPMVVVDLDKTIVASGFQSVLIGSPEPMAHSQAVLNRLAESYTIVYLTHRPNLFSIKSKAWLRENGYPVGPLLLSSLGGFVRGSGAFKSGMLDEIQGRFKNLRIGIGDKISDARAYHERGLESFLIVAAPQANVPEPYLDLAADLDSLDAQVQVVSTWRQIEDVLFGEGSYPRPAMQEKLRLLADQARPKGSDGLPPSGERP